MSRYFLNEFVYFESGECRLIRIKEAIVVEGRYDKIKLSSLVDTVIITTDGYGIFHNKDKLEMIRTLAKERGLIVLTDSDFAGFRIRNYIKNALVDLPVSHAYIPDVYGKEKRKASPGKEGKIGVEGIESNRLLQSLLDCGATVLTDMGKLSDEKENTASTDDQTMRIGANQDIRKITRFDLYQDGYSGRPDSVVKREMLLKRLDLPEHLSTKMLGQIINMIISYEKYQQITREINQNGK